MQLTYFMDIIRNIAPLLNEYLTIFPVVGIIGPRQVGKTTLAKSLAKLQPVLYLDLESSVDRQKLANPELYLQNHQNKLIILDEIQQMPQLMAELRGIIDNDRRVGRFIILGSASPALIKKSADSLAGRIGYIELSPFTVNEVNTENETKLWHRGGFPLSYLASTERGSMIWRKNFIRTYIEKDLALLGLSAEPQTIERFWRMLASVHGNLWNSESIGRSMGLTHPTINRYLDLMEGAFLVRRLKPYFVNIPKRLVKSPKIYLRDSGIFHAFKDIMTQDDLLDDPQVGASWEGFVIEQIIETMQNVLMNGQAYFYRTQQGAECDLIIEHNGKVKAAIEIKFSSAPQIGKGFRITMEDTNAQQGFVIAKTNETYKIEKNITVTSLNRFLLDFLPNL
ncbi:AAA ATPase (plasmid) [Emticicia oligotrophica DSM 17448]|uniref:AAA ATPase n=2 Tax=Emticicia TaxID=312278 RepID=A0ABM5N8G8_EMTOG|nr:AAA ATPase [Emticicia oligotrophica DSM 17448]